MDRFFSETQQLEECQTPTAVEKLAVSIPTVKVSTTSGEGEDRRWWLLVPRRRLLLFTLSCLHLQSRLLAFKADEESDVSVSKELVHLALNHAKHKGISSRSLKWVTFSYWAHRHPSLDVTYQLERSMLSAGELDLGYCGGTVKACLTLWLLPPTVISCWHKWYFQGKLSQKQKWL